MLDIQGFYAGKTVFITGTTGFIGKVVMEKILRSCSDVKMIYVSVRAKKGITPEDRLGEMLKSECFSVLWKEQPAL
jgi:alcohol-forming fatty acyl-CoA reductase